MLQVGLRMLTLRRLVSRTGDTLTVIPAERPVVAYYANSIEHFFATRGAPSTAPNRGDTHQHSARAVILVHGLARTSRSMARLATALDRRGI